MPTRDDLTDIPPIVPSRDDVSSHLQSRKGQAQEIVRSSHYAVKQPVSTTGVRIMLTILTVVMAGSIGGAYYFYQQYASNLQQSELRIGDLERRLALVGDSAEDSFLNIQESFEETTDFHFSEIDKLWATRNKMTTDLDDIRSELAKLVLINGGQDEVAANLSKQVTEAGTQLNASNTKLNSIVNEFDELKQSVASMTTALSNLEGLRTEMQTVRTALNSGDSNILGLIGRLEYVEQSMESVNAHRLQINESLFRMQETLDALQRQATPAVR